MYEVKDRAVVRVSDEYLMKAKEMKDEEFTLALSLDLKRNKVFSLEEDDRVDVSIPDKMLAKQLGMNRVEPLYNIDKIEIIEPELTLISERKEDEMWESSILIKVDSKVDCSDEALIKYLIENEEFQRISYEAQRYMHVSIYLQRGNDMTGYVEAIPYGYGIFAATGEKVTSIYSGTRIIYSYRGNRTQWDSYRDLPELIEIEIPID